MIRGLGSTGVAFPIVWSQEHLGILGLTLDLLMGNLPGNCLLRPLEHPDGAGLGTTASSLDPFCPKYRP